MSISDIIVVMKNGVLQQIGKPQDVYDDPVNLFVAKFLGTPPINVFEGNIKNGALFIGEDAILPAANLPDQEVWIGIRPEGFVPDENGPLRCRLNHVEVMGRDISIISEHSGSEAPTIRSIINADYKIDTSAETICFSLKPHKVCVFNKQTEARIAL